MALCQYFLFQVSFPVIKVIIMRPTTVTEVRKLELQLDLNVICGDKESAVRYNTVHYTEYKWGK
jgi:hypothetical protein